VTTDQQESKHFEARHIKKMFGIDRNKLFYWTKTHGLLKPEVEEPEGTGNRAKFSFRNLLEIALIQEMLKYGFDLRTVKIIKKALEAPQKQLGGLNLIDYSLKTSLPLLYSVSILSIKQRKASFLVNYYDEGKVSEAEKKSHELPRPNAFFHINEGLDPANQSPFISVKIEIGQLAENIHARAYGP